MKIDVSASPYRLDAKEKKEVLAARLEELTKLHKANCPEYRRVVSAAGVPMPALPVGLFKERILTSTTENHKIVTSSGTTNQKKSQITIDSETAALQQAALAAIGTDFLGEKRLPMLVIDCASTITDKRFFSARTAAILGFSLFGARRTFALNEDMGLNEQAVSRFLEMWGGEPFLIFGFTYIVWQYLYKTGIRFDFSNGILVHGGGWKKLQGINISKEEFKNTLKREYNICEIHDYYGMAEQAGSIFMECSEGYFHCSDYSDVKVLRPADFSEAGFSESGLIQVMSALPESYPGHNLLTEDEGIIIGEDDCHCGRKGKYFTVTGRVKEAELRGCSDTREPSAGQELRFVLGGCVSGQAIQAFDRRAIEFLEIWSDLIRKSERDASDAAFAFWIRKANLTFMAEKCGAREGCGKCFIIAPSNIPALWAYNLALAVMTGNCAVIRLPSSSDEHSVLINALKEAIENRPFWKERIALVKYGHEKEITEQFSSDADIRIIWGGNDSINEIQKSGLKDGCREITFPTRHSIGIMDTDGINERNMDSVIHSFYNDTYLTDQNACSSPNVIVWRGKNYREVREMFWKALYTYLKGRYEVSAKNAAEKWQKAMLLAADGKTDSICHEDNLIVRAWVDLPDSSIWDYTVPGGFFIETDREAQGFIDGSVQTVVFYGCEPEQIKGLRTVPEGHALDFSYFWDGIDLLKEMTDDERNI